MTSESISTEWTGGEATSGLLRAILAVPDLDAEARLQVEVDGVQILDSPAIAHHDGRIHVNFHTHLMENGKRTIGLALSCKDGVQFVEKKVDVCNVGAQADRTRDALSKHAVPPVFFGDCDSAYYDRAQAEYVHWIDRPDAPERIAQMQSAGEITQSEAQMLQRFIRDGFVVLDETLPSEMVERANSALDRAVEEKYQGYDYGTSTRLEQMHQGFPEIRDIWLHAPVHRFLSLVFESPSQPCQSLVYVFGSQQDAHQDTVHLTPFPAGLMCGVWFALEDVRPDSGELCVYPGSHRLPRVYMKDVQCGKVRGDWNEFGEKVVGRWGDLLAESGIEPLPYLAKKGDILVWHENLMHAGSVRRDKSLSRRSVVTHNFAKGAIVYYDSSGNVGHVHDSPN